MTASPSDSRAARDLRARVDREGGSLYIGARDLRDWFGRSRLTRPARREMTDALRGAGLDTDPAIDVVELTDTVLLYVAETARRPRPADAPPPPPPPPDRWGRWSTWPQGAKVGVIAAAVLLFVVIGLTGDESSDDPGGEPTTAQEAADAPSDGRAEARALERERAQERRRARERKREQARERARERRRAQRRREARERRAAERRERERREREERKRQQSLTPPEEESAGCEPGYDPCVPSYPPDLDCPDIGGSVAVSGSDPHGLDADNDGVGCE